MTDTLTYSSLLSKSTQQTGSIRRPRVLITGCSTGIGYYTAKEMHKSGNYIVVASCRKKKDVERLQLEGLHCVQIDLDSSESIKEGIKNTLLITNNELDVLINNGAYGQAGAVEDLSREVLEKQFSSNLFGTHELTVRLVKKLLESEKPRIIQISSVLGLVAMHYRGAYISSKFALEGLTDAMRLEFFDTKLKISLIEPGPIKSNFRQNAKKNFIKNINMNKSRHIDSYKIALKRMESTKKQPFTLTERAVYTKIEKVISSKNPKPRYYVTKPTYIFGFLRRILSTKMLDRILLKASSDELDRFNKK